MILNPVTTVPGRDACEIKMFHQEDAGLNVEMAKLVFSKGIWSYVCKMDGALRKYSTVRRPQSSSFVNAIMLIKMVSTSPPCFVCWSIIASCGFGSMSRYSGLGNHALLFNF